MAVYYFAPTIWYSKYFAQPLVTLSSAATPTSVGMRMHKSSARDYPVNKFGNIGDRAPGCSSSKAGSSSSGSITPTLDASSELGSTAPNNVWQQLNSFSIANPLQSEKVAAIFKPSFGHSDSVMQPSEHTTKVDDLLSHEPKRLTSDVLDAMESNGAPELDILSPIPRHFDAIHALRGWESVLALEDSVVDVDRGQTRDFIRAPGKPRSAFPSSTKGAAIPAPVSLNVSEKPGQSKSMPVGPTTKEDLWKSAASLFDFSYMKRCNNEYTPVKAATCAGSEEIIPKDRSRLLTILGY